MCVLMLLIEGACRNFCHKNSKKFTFGVQNNGPVNNNCEAVCEIKWPLQITANLLSAEYRDLSIN